MKMPFVAQFYGVWLLLKKFGVILQDSPPPSVVRREFFAVGMAACGCHAHSKKQRRQDGCHSFI